WDRFPHLAITSPEGRCGKTRLLELLEQVCRKAWVLVNVSPPALYRRIKQERPTLLLDEAQSLVRRGSEGSEVLREIFCGSVSKNAMVSRCSGPDHEPTNFPIYCPKAMALIGKLEGVLADRSLPVLMKRKKKGDKVKKCRMKLVEAEGASIKAELCEWASSDDKREKAKALYDELETFDIENDRMAELLLPLQAILIAEGG